MQFVPAAGIQVGGAPLQALCAEPARVASAFPHAPFDPASYPARAKEIAAHYQVDRARLVEGLERYNRAIGSDAPALANIRRLLSPEALTVVTGQQAGFLTGPLYVMLKAATAVRLAHEQEQALGVPVVPVFWVASEDHDYQEIATAVLLGEEAAVRISLPEPPPGRFSIGHLPVPVEMDALLDEVAAALPPSEHRDTVMERLRSLARPLPGAEEGVAGESLAAYFARLMAWLFAGTGLVIADPMQPALRSLAAPFLAEAIERQPAVAMGLAQGIANWQQLGFEPTLDAPTESLHLFTYHRGQRMLLHAGEESIYLRDEPETAWARSELAQVARSLPDRLSTGVALRPVLQGWLLPDLAYVGGPGEIAYWGLLQPVFAAMGRTMPVLYPRFSATLVEPPLARNMSKQGLTLADVMNDLDERRREMLEREDRLGLGDRFAHFRQQFDAHYDELLSVLFQLDSGLKPFTEENHKQILGQFKKLEEKAQQQHRKNCEVALRQFQRLAQHLHPGGRLQERVFTPITYLAKYGPDLFARMAGELPLGSCQHWEVHL